MRNLKSIMIVFVSYFGGRGYMSPDRQYETFVLSSLHSPMIPNIEYSLSVIEATLLRFDLGTAITRGIHKR